jgi:hypothetical protein
MSFEKKSSSAGERSNATKTIMNMVSGGIAGMDMTLYRVS